MSRAFVKEDSEGDNTNALPERAIPAHPNYVTPRGLALLQAQVRDLAARCEVLKREASEESSVKDQLRAFERDLRYFRAQLERAERVEPAQSPHDEVHFGAIVTLCEDGGVRRRIRIVGDDEADAAAGDISWASPLARALIGARVGESVTWQRPSGAVEIEILTVEYLTS
jgi:transcription elongation GreA/GreB family factor